MLEKQLFKDDATLPKCADDRPPLLSLGTAVKPVEVPAPASENAIPEVDYLLNAEVTAPRLPKLPIPGGSSLSTVDALLWPAGVGPYEDVWVHVRGHGVPVTAPVCGVAVSHDLHVLLRHRLPRQAEVGEGAIAVRVEQE